MSLAADKKERIGRSRHKDSESTRYAPLLWWLLAMVILASIGYAIYAFIDNQEETELEASLHQKQQVTHSKLSSGLLPEIEPDRELVINEHSKADVLQLQEVKENKSQTLDFDKYNFDLPALDKSDAVTRNGIAGLSSHPTVLRSLQGNRLIERFTLLIDSIKRGKLPHKQFKAFAPKGHFIAREQNSGVYVLDPENYNRYDYVAKIFGSLDPHAVSEVYNKLKPLFQEAYENLGYPNQNVDDALLTAIGRIESTPVLTGEVRLIRPSVMYKYADSNLEAMNSVQKQLIRMGPGNTKIIQAKLKEIKKVLMSSD